MEGDKALSKLEIKIRGNKSSSVFFEQQCLLTGRVNWKYFDPYFSKSQSIIYNSRIIHKNLNILILNGVKIIKEKEIKCLTIKDKNF